MGYDPIQSQVEQHTVAAVLDEIKDRNARVRIDVALDVGNLKITEPTSQSRDRIISVSSQSGDISSISNTDIDVLALALDIFSSGRSCLIVTDDYAVQNISNQLGIRFKALTAKGIRYQFQWRLSCPACGRTYPQEFKGQICPVCGTQLRRRVTNKKRRGDILTP
jgi:UPF0271 protein